MTMPGPTDVGVVIGRFQVPNFHQGHRELLRTVSNRHRRVLILLGMPRWKGGKKDPLDYVTRAQMFSAEYPSFTVAPIMDCQSDEAWSKRVDERVRELFPLENITLYGGRDGFIKHYHGSLPTVETPENAEYSGTIERAIASALPKSTEDFRSGVIYSVYSLADRPIMCVDAAILKKMEYGVAVCLIQKPGEHHWRFPGGHLDNTDTSLEQAAGREAREETGLEIGKPTYVGSECGVPEWRAMQAGLGLASSLFAFPYVYGSPKGGDDAAIARFFMLNDITKDHMEKCHQGFLGQLQDWVEKDFKKMYNFFGYKGEQ